VGFVVLNLLQLRPNYWPIFKDVQQEISLAVQPGETILGAHTYWLGLHDHTYYSWVQLVYYQRYLPGSTLDEALQSFRPDILIIDAHFEGAISDEPGASIYSQTLRVSRAEMDAILANRAELISVVGGENYGEIRVYRLSWDDKAETIQVWAPVLHWCQIPAQSLLELSVQTRGML
jgi:hypothetical protein